MYAKAEQLIRMVQNNPVLYDTTNVDYCKSKIKDAKWNYIAKTLNIESAKKARAQWTKLRDCHRDALRRQDKKRKNGSKDVRVKPWIYQHQMEFLVPFMTSSGTTSETEIVMCSDEDSQFPEMPVVVIDTSNNDSQQDVQADHCYTTNPPLKKQRVSKYEIFQERLMGPNLEKSGKKNEADGVKQKDALKQFFDSMYNLTKAMPHQFQMKIRRQLFEAVTEAEEEIFTNPSRPSSSSNGTYGFLC